MEVGSRLRRSCSLSQRQSVLSSMLVVIVTLQSLVSNLEWKRYSLHEILPFTNLWWPPGLCPGSPSLGREGGEHLPSLFRTLSLSSQVSAALTFLFFPGFRFGSAPKRGALPVPLISISQAHTPISLPESLSPATPAALPHSLYTPILTCRSFLAAACFRQYVPQGQRLCVPQTCPVSSHPNL